MHLPTELLRKVVRFAGVVVVGLALQPTAAATNCDSDMVCEPSQGENPGNCADCGWCGDTVCQELEGCGTCPFDCYSDCTCGDFRCDYPAEGAGQGSGMNCELDSPLGPNCQFCGQDCFPACSHYYCSGYSCNPENGNCEECDDVSFCPDPYNYTCDGGECVPIASCPVESEQ